MASPEEQARNANLDALKTEAKKYFAQERQRLDTETKFLRSALIGRGARGAAALNLGEMSKLVQDSVSAFLQG